MWATLQDYGRRTCRFVRRHRTPIVVGSVAVGVGAALYFRTSRFLEEVNELRDDLETSLVSRRKRARQLERTRFECKQAVESFLPSLRARLAGLIDTNAVVHQLKALRHTPSYKQKRLEMWEELKTSAFVRYLAMLYALCMLNLLLRLQLHVLGRRVFLGALRQGEGDGDDPDSVEMDAAERHRLLSVTYEYLLGDGLKELVESCKAAVEQTLKDWTVATKRKVPFGDLRDVVHEVRALVETSPENSPDLDREGDEERSPLVRFLIHPEARTADRQSRAVRMCLQETWDLAESTLFLEAMEDTLAKVFELALSEMQKLHFQADSSVNSEEKNAETTQAVAMEQPLAHIITAFQNETTKLLETQPDGQASTTSALYIDEIGNLESVNTLCAAAFGLDDEELEELLG